MAERTLEQPAKTWAREYETIYILRPNVETEEAAKVAGRVRDVMEKMGGKLTKVDTWGKRRLAYSIGKFSRGIFVYLSYAAYGDLVAELERNLRLLDPVIRYQTIVLADRVELDQVTVEDSEIEFSDIEQTDDDDDEPTTAQRLGMEERARDDRSESRSDDDEDSDEDSDDEDSDDDDSEEEDE